ncbi:MAG TPA: hypothetical protein VI138_07625 [Candidatus Dormibacteraeota bacterium]
MPDVQAAEYEAEIAELQRKLVELQENEAAPPLLEEYAAEVQILKALLGAARALERSLQEDQQLSSALALRGFQPGQFRDVYAFVYETALEIDKAGAQFAREIEATDFSLSLRETG